MVAYVRAKIAEYARIHYRSFRCCDYIHRLPKNKPDTLTPFGDTVEYPSNPSNPGNPAMFNGGGIDNTIQGHVKSHDDQRYAAMPEPRDDGDEDVEGSIQNLAVSTTTQAEIEEVNPAQIK